MTQDNTEPDSTRPDSTLTGSPGAPGVWAEAAASGTPRQLLLRESQSGYERSSLARLDGVVAHVVRAVGIPVPDFTAIAAAAGPGAGGSAGGGLVAMSGIPGITGYATPDPAAEARVAFVKAVHEAKKPAGTWSELCTRLDKTQAQAQRFALKALKARFLLPRLYRRVQEAGVGFDRLDYAAGRAFEIDPALYDFYDRCLETIDERAGMASFKATVDTAIALLKTPSHNGERAHEERCVRFSSLGDGRSVVEMTGPSLEVEAFMKRLQAFARNIRINLAGVLDGAETIEGTPLEAAGIDPASVGLADERTMAQLMFDMLIAYTPALGITITHTTPPMRPNLARMMPTRAEAMPTAIACVRVTRSRGRVRPIPRILQAQTLMVRRWAGRSSRRWCCGCRRASRGWQCRPACPSSCP